MNVSAILLSFFIGLIVTMSFAGPLSQPDWGLAILIAVLLSQRTTWYWVLPCVILHDLFVYWSAWVMLPYMASTAFLVFYADKRLGPGQQQRWFALLLISVGLHQSGLDGLSVLLTVTLTIWLWSLFSAKEERVHVEST